MVSHPSINTNRVVIALLDGRRLKGYVYDFIPEGKTLNVFPSCGNPQDKRPAVEVEVAACKAIFFVRTHEGNREAAIAQRAAEQDPKTRAPRGRKVRVVFSDGEEMMCCTEFYNAHRLGFFVYPLDPRSNNLRIFIVNANVRQVVTGRILAANARTRPDQERVAHLALPGSIEEEGPSPDLKCEAALRVLGGEAPVDLEKDYGVPAAELTRWTRSFLKSGRGALCEDGGTGSAAADTLIRELKKRIRDLEKDVETLRKAPPKSLSRG